MQSLIREERVQLSPSLTVTVRELSVRRAQQLIDYQKGRDVAESAAMACKLGVVEWGEESVEEIMDNVGFAVVVDLAARIQRLSGLSKDDASPNSDPAPSASSSIG